MARFVSRIFSVHQMASVIRDARIARGWTQEDMAQKTGLSRVWINRFEQCAITDPGMMRILTMCDVLGIDISASYDPERQLPLPRPQFKKPMKSGTPTTADLDTPTIRPKTMMEAAMILESLARRASESATESSEGRDS